MSLSDMTKTSWLASAAMLMRLEILRLLPWRRELITSFRSRSGEGRDNFTHDFDSRVGAIADAEHDLHRARIILHAKARQIGVQTRLGAVQRLEDGDGGNVCLGRVIRTPRQNGVRHRRRQAHRCSRTPPLRNTPATPQSCSSPKTRPCPRPAWAPRPRTPRLLYGAAARLARHKCAKHAKQLAELSPPRDASRVSR